MSDERDPEKIRPLDRWSGRSARARLLLDDLYRVKRSDSKVIEQENPSFEQNQITY
jgi:hypothetical protein